MRIGFVVGELALLSHTFVIGRVEACGFDVDAEPMRIAHNPVALAFSASASCGNLGII
jgi:hypothetical protein